MNRKTGPKTEEQRQKNKEVTEADGPKQRQ